MNAPTNLERAGFTRSQMMNFFKPGAEVTVYGFRFESMARRSWSFRKAVLADGREFKSQGRKRGDMRIRSVQCEIHYDIPLAAVFTHLLCACTSSFSSVAFAQRGPAAEAAQIKAAATECSAQTHTNLQRNRIP